ncbi:TauD/TfdA family dioxygenase [Actinacidiphila sp. bgisy145]|uniref:TauD/TfdA family dioxygenase n=1 Tax=Actinacidiphila sp. bgisy145 TaxID=3413792 RepID=UPI003EBB645E
MANEALLPRLFAAHYVDIRGADAPTEITAQLRGTGLVTMNGLQSREAVVDAASALLHIVPHRDSEPDGLTVVRDTGRHSGLSGFAGLSNVALAAHTEGSGISMPPRLMMLVCATPAAAGGECMLVDGQAIYDDLLEREPTAVEALSDERAGLFGGQSGVLGPVFQHHQPDRVALRLRLDDLVRWNPLAQRFVPALVDSIARNSQGFDLAPGNAYLIDNHRWLHGRTAFAGNRLLYRVLGNPRVSMSKGFPISARGRLPLVSEPTG